MTEQNQSLEEVVQSYLDRRGGVVIERLIGVLKRIHDPDAPELASEDAFKEWLESKPDMFRIAVSSSGVERARLSNPRRASQGLIGSAIAALEELKAQDEASACKVTVLYEKIVASKTAELGEGEALPYDLASREEFVRSVQRFKRIRFEDDKVWIVPRAQQRHSGARGEHNGGAADGQTSRNRSASGQRERRSRPAGTPQEPQDCGNVSEANDATFIASLIYKKLCERGAVDMNLGLTVKLLLRLVSIDFKEARPDSEPVSMNSLRVFKMLLAQIPGIRRQRPRVQSRSPRRNGRPPRYTPELIIWMENEDELVAGIQAGLPDDAANIVVPPDVIDNIEQLEAGTPVQVQILDHESWSTRVVGPTSNEEVLASFLTEHQEQAVWGLETEHRVGLHGKPAGKIAIIVLSDMNNTIVWDVHVGGIPPCLATFLANDKIFKGGVRIGPKMQKFRKQFNVTPTKFVELSTIAHGLGLISDEEKERISIRIMTNNIVKTPVARPPGIRDSNWELRPLTKRQYNYAVEDGFISALLFMHLVAQLHQKNEGVKLNEACISID